MLFVESKGINHAQGFVDAAAEWQVIDDAVADNAFLVDEEGAAQGYGFIKEDAVITGDGLADVSNQWVGNLADATFLGIGVAPCEVRELAVYGDTDDLRTLGRELSGFLLKAMISDGQTKVKSSG